MVTCATVMKSLLVAAVVVVLSGQGSAVEKFADCCTQVDIREITEPILGFMTQRKSGSCVNAIIFQTETGFYCSKHDEPWVRRKIQALRAQKAQPASTTSLLELITSSSSPPSTAPPSSTMERTTGMRSTQHTVQ
ncbi:hypothetical protein N1851_018853 [Merluccius polli]|uniref:Chemokine interleukin-8-like domain-containing protein n=1 Tax=Merluccius polli TaxID=89951 RepID=A0AA47MMX1_MERPO|nr:hypothetical protein N1851_018853 [Merluccius polli]